MPIKVEEIGFDSILVRLKGSLKAVAHCFLTSFDSILVRLKVFSIEAMGICAGMFRFHTGSIKSVR